MKKMMIVAGMMVAMCVQAEMKVNTALTTDKNAFAAGEAAAKKIKAQLGEAKPAVVVMAECYTEKADKAEALKGVTSVLGKDVVVSMAVYGIYTQEGAKDKSTVGLLALSGEGVTARQALSDAIQGDFTNAAKRLAQKLPVKDDAKLMLVLADCHSPRNQFFLDGLQSVYGTALPMAGGSANKNAGFNWIGHAGELHTDVAALIALNGPFKVSQAGDQARDNDAVLKTAEDTAMRIRQGAKSKLTGAVFFDCAGRKGKLESIDEEQAAIAKGLGAGIPFFGIWCAGEVGVANDSKGVPVGRGWHIMGTGICE
jgi:hypothetical protein